MKITDEMIRRGATSESGGWNHRQLECLGIYEHPRPVWIQRLIGTEISEANYALFLINRKTRKPRPTNSPKTTQEFNF